ncbi:MAG: hypothetical protein AAF944_29670 [Bacteroidota bacterium]
MKTLSVLSVTLCLLALVLACQPEEVAPLKPKFGRPIDDKTLTPISTSIPPDEVVQTDFSGATYSLSDLNASTKATTQADIEFLFGSIKAATEYEGLPYPNHPQIHLQYPEAARDTQFVPSDLSQWELAVMTVNHPEQFQDAFENSPYWATSYQPYNYNEGGEEPPSYQTGEIYLFKTDSNPARYGAIRIVEKTFTNLSSSQYVIEITVQADNYTIDIGG